MSGLIEIPQPFPTPDTYRSWLELFHEETGEELTHIQFIAIVRSSRAQEIQEFPVSLLGRTLPIDDPRIQSALDFEWLNGARQSTRLLFTAWSANYAAYWQQNGPSQQLNWIPARPALTEHPATAPRPRTTIKTIWKGRTK